MRAWILLGINAAFGNSDLSRLRVEDARGAWLAGHRAKNGMERKAWLWPDTRHAIRVVLDRHKGGELLFATAIWKELVDEDGTRDAVAECFEACVRSAA